MSRPLVPRDAALPRVLPLKSVEAAPCRLLVTREAALPLLPALASLVPERDEGRSELLPDDLCMVKAVSNPRVFVDAIRRMLSGHTDNRLARTQTASIGIVPCVRDAHEVHRRFPPACHLCPRISPKVDLSYIRVRREIRGPNSGKVPTAKSTKVSLRLLI